jgi:hypothetical protein
MFLSPLIRTARAVGLFFSLHPTKARWPAAVLASLVSRSGEQPSHQLHLPPLFPIACTQVVSRQLLPPISAAPWRPRTPASEASVGRCGGQGNAYTIGLLPLHEAAALLLQEQDRIHLAFDLFDEMPDRVNKPIGELPAPILLSLCKPAFEPK